MAKHNYCQLQASTHTSCGGAFQARTKEPRALCFIRYAAAAAAAAAVLPSVSTHLAIRADPNAGPKGEIPRVNLPVRGQQGQWQDSDSLSLPSSPPNRAPA